MNINDIIKQDLKAAFSAHRAGAEKTALCLLNQCLDNGADCALITNAARAMGLISNESRLFPIRSYTDIYPSIEIVHLIDRRTISNYAIDLEKPETPEQRVVYRYIWEKSNRFQREDEVDLHRRVNIAVRKLATRRAASQPPESKKESVDYNKIWRENLEKNKIDSRTPNPFKTKDRPDYIFR